MTEPTIQVPVSLIEDAPHGRDCTGNLLAAFGAPSPCNCWKSQVLSQPTPTAEPMTYSAADVQGAFERGVLRGEQDANERNHSRRQYEKMPTTAPPRIEDLAPGTTFTEEVRWTVTGTLSTGVTVAHSDRGEMRFADQFNPSTIRA